LTGFIGWDRACCNFETAVGDEFYTLATRPKTANQMH